MLLKGLNLGPHKYEFSSLAVSLSLEGKASHRELTSRLLSDLSGKLLSQSDMARAFDKMLKELPDLILDTPEAPQVRMRGEGCVTLCSSIESNRIQEKMLCKLITVVARSLHFVMFLSRKYPVVKDAFV